MVSRLLSALQQWISRSDHDVPRCQAIKTSVRALPPAIRNEIPLRAVKAFPYYRLGDLPRRAYGDK